MPRKLNDDTKTILDAVRGFTSAENPSSLRFIFYRLVSLGLLENKRSHYVKITRTLLAARIRGDVDDNSLVDNRRSTHRPASWTGLEDFMNTVRHAYRRDFWADQPKRVELLVEKATVGEVLKGVATEYNVPLRISSGFYSRPFLSSIADDIADTGKPCVIGYIGDFDPSGFDIERAAMRGNGKSNTRRREGLLDILEQRHSFTDVTWSRIAVTESDFKTIPAEAKVKLKSGDPRLGVYEPQYGHYGCEVEALSQDVLQNRVRAFIRVNMKARAWKASERVAAQDAVRLAELCGA